MHRRTQRLLPLALLVSLLAPLARAASEPAVQERWYVALFDGNRAGYMHNRVTEEGERITTESHTRFSIKRGRVGVTVTVETAFVETDRGEPISARSKMNMGAMGSQEVRWTFKDRTRLVQETIAGASRREDEVTLATDAWLTPHAAGEFVEARLQAGADTIEYTTLDLTMGTQLIEMRHEIVEETTVEALGRTVPALKARSTISAMPGVVTTDYIDPETGEPIRMDVPLGAINVTMLAADKELALSDVEPTELMVSTLVEPKGSIPRPRQTKQATYILSLADGESLADVPSTAAQTAQRLDDGRVRVTVDLTEARAEEDPAVIEQALEASPFVDCADPRIVELTEKATSNAGDDPKERAKAIRKFVYEYVSGKGLDVGFASASETARTRTGDCTEHAVLMAAMLRADGIPARVASGLIYADQFLNADGVFGYHMWTQALLADDEGVKRWVDFDPAWPNRFDATHILLSTSLLDSADGTPANDMVVLVPLLGNLQIEIVETK